MSTKLLSKSKIELKDYIEINGKKYVVDGIKVIFEPSKKELHIALWLSKKLNKKIEVLPRIKQPEGINTSDYIINNENWDLKRIISNRNDAVRNIIRNHQKQASYFVIDITDSKLTIKATIKQINDIFNRKGYKWFNKAIIKKNNAIEFVNRK